MNRSVLTGKSLKVRARNLGIAFMMLFAANISFGQGQLACNDNLQLSLDDNCFFQVYIDHLLEAPPLDTTCLIIEITDQNGNVVPGNLFNSTHRNQEFNFAVIDTCLQNSCWGMISVEDKLAPQFICQPYDSVWCSDTTYTLPPDRVFEACGTYRRIILEDKFYDYPCDSACAGKRFITYYYVDEVGNESNTCTKEVCYRRATLDDVVMPEDTIFSCDEFVDADPLRTGVPLVDGFPIYPESPACEINCTYEDQTIDICPQSFKILRKWTCYDWCQPTSSNNPTIEWQVIKVVDEDPPVVYCPTTDQVRDTVGTDAWACTGSYILPQPHILNRGQKIVDSFAVYILAECSDVSYYVEHVAATNPEDCTPDGTFPTQQNVRYDRVLDRWIAFDLPLGCNWFYYTFTDECGNSSQCTFDIYVEDDVPPVPICDEHTTVTLNHQGVAKIFAPTFDDGSLDNCEIDSFDVRRMDAACDSVGWDEFGPYVLFCCADLGRTVMVEFRVWDKAGNSNTCMVEVTVNDKEAPRMIPPPDLTVGCDFYYDPDDLSVFGKVVDDENLREAIIIRDDNYLPDYFAGIDGYAWDNCQDITITDTAFFDLVCGTGMIIRRFTATDPGGRSVSMDQKITFVDRDPFDYDDIIWPTPKTQYGCIGIDTDTSITGAPRFQNVNCARPAVTYDDLIFTQVPDACYKIERTWTVVDWCAFDRGRQIWQWSYKQIIKVTDEEDPVFRSCDPLVFCDDEAYLDQGQCVGSVLITPDVEDACTKYEDLRIEYRIDAFSTGSYGAWMVGDTVQGDYPVGVHTIQWNVADGCGNEARCTQTFEVQDCKAPTPYCRTGIITVLMEGSGSIDIWASDFNIGSFDNCTDTADLKYSFSSDTTDIKRTYNCDSLAGRQQITRIIRMYVTDEQGNQDYCETTISIQNNGKCPGSLTANISGKVTDEFDSAIQNVEISVVSVDNGLVVKSGITDIKGEYNIDGLARDRAYEVHAFKNDDHLNGVSTRDITFIQRELLGKEYLESAYKRIAADANFSGSMTAGDISAIRKLILGKYAQFPNAEAWTFTPSDFVMNDVMKPWDAPAIISVGVLTQDRTNADFVGMKVGDVDNSAELSNASSNGTRGGAIYTMGYQKTELGNGQVRIDFLADEYHTLSGMQMTMDLGSATEILDVHPGAMMVERGNFSDHAAGEGLLTFSWTELDGMNEADVLMTLVLDGNSDDILLNLSDEITRTEAYNNFDEIMSVELYEVEANDAEGEFELMQNIPNPFTGFTTIHFVLPQPQEFTLSFYDPSGRLINKVEGFGSKGDNSVQISQSDLTGSGGAVVFYQLDTEDRSATKKLIMIK